MDLLRFAFSKTVFLTFLSALTSILLFNTLTTTVHDDFLAPPSLNDLSVRLALGDTSKALRRLSEAVRFPTISYINRRLMNATVFKDFHSFLRSSFPLVHEQLKIETVNELSLLLKWGGSSEAKDGEGSKEDTNRLPILLLAHQDVVAVTNETLGKWEHPPFDGVITEGGFLYGRGTLDMKGMLMAQLEAVEKLLRAGFRPDRTIYFAFGHDEEVGGSEGAAKIAEILRERGLAFEFVLDEGLVLAKNALPGVPNTIALIGIAEKGSINYHLKVTSPGGHASMPTRENAIEILSAALSRLAQNPPPATLRTGIISHLLKRITPHTNIFLRLVLSNLWLFEPLVLRFVVNSGSAPWLNSISRTTIATTKVSGGGVGLNVLPQTVEANLNVRILPGETIASVKQFIADVIADDRVSVETNTLDRCAEPSKVSRIDTETFRLFGGVIRKVFDSSEGDGKRVADGATDKPVIVAPGLFLAGSDSVYYQDLTEHVFKFQPIVLDPKLDVPRIHGVNERIHVNQYDNMIRFFANLILTFDNTP